MPGSRKRSALLLAAALIAGASAARAQTAQLPVDQLGIVPQPRSVAASPATYPLPDRIAIEAVTPPERHVAEFAARFLQSRGIDASIVRSAGAGIALSTDPSLQNEAYRLHIGADGVRMTAAGGAGLYYALQTFEQIAAASPPHTVYQTEVEDAPAYPWRGIHLDVSRHFFPVPVVERYIDLASHYKLNTFHWHLTDDQGWRIQIKRYPRLTQIGSCRDGTEIDQDATQIDGKRYCGYYTQDQIRSVVAYAAARYVRIVPEIEMPGHSAAAVAAYPWLTCQPGNYKVLQVWGISKQIFCPTPRTMAFLKNVLDEVVALFPGTYVHVGGDEVPSDAWQHSAFVRSLMRREHFKSYFAVQGYFTRTMEPHLLARGRRMVGWDEILAGGVSRTATIMSWRGIDGGIAAARAGNDVVMSPDPELYLDQYQGDPAVEPQAIGGYETLERVYTFDPMPAGLTPAQQRHILGAQGNLWTEYVPTAQRLFYRLLPRELAIAELTWTPAAKKSWLSFQARMPAQYAWLLSRHYPFHVPNPQITLQGASVLQFPPLALDVRTVDVTTSEPAAMVTIAEAVPGSVIRYTLDGREPSHRSARYTAPLQLHLAPGSRTELRAAATLPDGTESFSSGLVIYRTAQP